MFELHDKDTYNKGEVKISPQLISIGDSQVLEEEDPKSKKGKGKDKDKKAP